jgi:hypothetical protein
MTADDELEKRVAAQLERLREKEAEKKMLYDKSIGGPQALRPSDAFIERNVGRLKTEEQLRQEARQKALKELKTERVDRERRAAAEKSLRAHTRRIEERRQQKKIAEESRKEQNAKRTESFIDRVRKRIEAAKKQADRQRLDRGKDDERYR